MRSKKQRLSAIMVILVFFIFAIGVLIFNPKIEKTVVAKESDSKSLVDTSPTPEFDQKAALAKLREQIKGKEKLPSGEVFKNIKSLKQVPAGTLLRVMEFGVSRSLGVNCTHCHTPENWASEEKPAKQIAREMHAMTNKINQEMLTNFKAFEGRTGRNRPIVNCTTCHRGQIKPATNLGRPRGNPKPDPNKKKQDSNALVIGDWQLDGKRTSEYYKNKGDEKNAKRATQFSNMKLLLKKDKKFEMAMAGTNTITGNWTVVLDKPISTSGKLTLAPNNLDGHQDMIFQFKMINDEIMEADASFGIGKVFFKRTGK